MKEAIHNLHVAIRLYNSERPHLSISKLTPERVHHANEPLNLKRQWKNYYPNKKATVNSYQD
ncbi:MAG: hypothetical protein LC117_04685 [Bacteroidia bacterium]|nr:hypothetical protein [Bacteroidia bacterium]